MWYNHPVKVMRPPSTSLSILTRTGNESLFLPVRLLFSTRMAKKPFTPDEDPVSPIPDASLFYSFPVILWISRHIPSVAARIFIKMLWNNRSPFRTNSNASLIATLPCNRRLPAVISTGHSFLGFTLWTWRAPKAPNSPLTCRRNSIRLLLHPPVFNSSSKLFVKLIADKALSCRKILRNPSGCEL